MNPTFPSFLDAWNRSQTLATPALHRDIAEWFDHRIAAGARRMLLLAFRGSGKSTLLGLLSAWLLKCNPDRRILVLAAESQLAAKTVRTVRRILERHPLTEALKPNRPEEWAADRLTVPRRLVSRDPSLLARGIGANITGSHADVAICDDVEVPNTCGTPAKRADLRARLSEIDYVLSPGGFQIYSGTPHSYYSIYAEHPRPEEGDKRPFLHGFDRLKRKLKPTAWPERFPKRVIQEIRKRAGPARFASQMMLEPVQAVDGRLNAEWLRRYEEPIDYSEVNGRPVLRLAGRRLVSASAWLDPSFGRRDKGDACVLAAVFTDEDGRRLLHRVAYLYYDPKNDRDGAAKQLCRQAAAHARKLLLPVVHVESNGMGAWIPKILERELAREGHGATVIGIPNSRPKHERILEAFDAPLAANALWAHASVFKSPFLRELREWRPENRSGPDDGLDAAACALLAEPVRIRRVGRAPRLEWRERASPGRARADFHI